MANSNYSGPVVSAGGFIEVGGAGYTDGRSSDTQAIQRKKVVITVVDGAAAGTYTIPDGVFTHGIWLNTPTAIPGTPSNTNVRVGTAANGQQIVADVDAKAAGAINATVTAAGRLATGTIHFTVASSGGTASAQDGTIVLYHEYSNA
jgi:hypothetical protein